MKDQYFGDINDYRKYGLLRAIMCAGDFRLLVAWMLTSDDGSKDGNFISYLDNPDKWSRHDPDLFLKIRELLSCRQQRRVRLIEGTELLPNAEYFSAHVPESALCRNTWFGALAQRVEGRDFVFLDPDNGLEVKSKPYGTKGSSKFLYWREIQALWATGKSLLIYQHFIREKRRDFIERTLKALESHTPGSLVEAFSTPHVVFLMALQPDHHPVHQTIVNTVQAKWAGQIRHWDLTRTQ